MDAERFRKRAIRMVSYFSFFVNVMFPVPAVLLALLLFPLPAGVQQGVLRLADRVLFFEPHPYVKVSVFWISFVVSLVTLFYSYQEYDERKDIYTSAKRGGGDQAQALIKLMAAERNCWISLTATGLWLILHRYRSLLKRCRRAEAVGETKPKAE